MSWRTGQVTDMREMFRSASRFNVDISLWDVSSVTNMDGMFRTAASFNHNIGGWDVSNVANMTETFYVAVSFNQNLCAWRDKVDWSVLKVTDMFFDSGCDEIDDPSVWSTSWCQVCA
jgi:surface protein